MTRRRRTSTSSKRDRKSVVSGKRIEELRAPGTKVWHSNKAGDEAGEAEGASPAGSRQAARKNS